MSHYYEMGLEVEDVQSQEEATKIAEVFAEQWSDSQTNDFYDTKSKTFECFSENSLCGGETEEDFTQRLSRAIWEALGRYAPISVRATYLEDLPTDFHIADEESYQELLKTQDNHKAG